MNKFKFMHIICAILFSTLFALPAFAGTGTGKVIWLRVSDNGFISFMTENYEDPPECARTLKTFSVKLTNEAGHAMLEMLLTAQAQDIDITVLGYGNCKDQSMHERTFYIKIER